MPCHQLFYHIVWPTYDRWQAEDGVISIGKSQLPQLVAYVERQQHHHGAEPLEDDLAGC